MGLVLLGDQVVGRNPHLLVFGVAGKANHLHTVEQGLWNAGGVGGGDEHDIGEVVVHLEVVVIERHVLLLVIRHSSDVVPENWRRSQVLLYRKKSF